MALPVNGPVDLVSYGLEKRFPASNKPYGGSDMSGGRPWIEKRGLPPTTQKRISQIYRNLRPLFR